MNIENTGIEFGLLRLIALVMALAFYVVIYWTKKFTTLVLWFLGIFLVLTGVYLAYNAQYLAFVQLLIYTGGVLLLTLFGMMFIPRDYRVVPYIKTRSLVTSVLISLGIFVVLSYSFRFDPVLLRQTNDSIKGIGILFFSNYLLIFELIALMLLVSLVGVSYLEKD